MIAFLAHLWEKRVFTTSVFRVFTTSVRVYIGDSLLGAPVGEEGTGTLFGGGASLYCRQLDERVPKVCPRGMELKKKKAKLH